jgi:hypothetical protein
MITSSMSDYLIQTSPTNQSFNIVIKNVTYIFTIIWRGICYVLDIGDANNQPIIQGIALVKNVDLLSQFAYIFPDFGLVVSGNGNVADPLTLGTSLNLYLIQ